MSTGRVYETFYVTHGFPIKPADEIKSTHYLREWRSTYYAHKPKAVLLVSAHWETDEPAVNAVRGKLDTYYDFTEAHESMYQIKYPAPGAPELATRANELLVAAGFESAYVDDEKCGLDHGAWVPLMLMYPDADIPIFELSVQPGKNGTHHYNVGKALAPLKEEGVLIVGSGTTILNREDLKRAKLSGDPSPPSWAVEFENWLIDALISGRYEDVNDYEAKAPHAKLAHPDPEHFLPLMVAMGASYSGPDNTSKAELIYRAWGFASLSLSSFKFTAN